MSKVGATLVVDGPRQLLRAMRKRLAESLAGTGATLRLAESQQDDRLQFRLSAEQGLPYPQLIAASAIFPDCVLSLDWQADGDRGVTTIRGGEVQAASGELLAGAMLPQAIEVDAGGALMLGVVIASASRAQTITGYAATRVAETYFKIAGGNPARACDDDAKRQASSRLVTAGGGGRHWTEQWDCERSGAWRSHAAASAQSIDDAEMQQLELAVAAYRARWLWYDQAPLEDTAIERARAAAADRSVWAINVQSRALAGLGESCGFDSIAAADRWLLPLLRQTWAAVDL